MPPTRSSRPSRSASGRGGPEWLGVSSGKARRSSSSCVSVLEQFDAAATLDAPGTPQLRDAPGGSPGARVSFRDDLLFVAAGDAHPAHVSTALRGRAEGLRIQAELLEKEAHQHEARHKLESGESCGAGAHDDIRQAWDKSVKALEQLCGAAVALCLSASSCGSAPPPRPHRTSTPRASALRPPGLAPIRSYERQLPLADPGPAPAPVAPGLPPQRSASILRRSSSGLLSGEAPPPVRQLSRSGSAPERRSKSVPPEEAPKAAPSGLWRRALRNLSNARRPGAGDTPPRDKGDAATGAGSPRAQTRFNFA